MAGPGGGPPRKSHTKSRNGCKTCKRRHIRCDESFPQCRNCTKHNCRCDYMDAAESPDESPRPRAVPDLLMSPEIEMEIENWYTNGVPPFLELSQCPRSGWYGLSRIHLRLIHHIVGLSIDLNRRGLSNCTTWAQKMPNFLAIGLSNEFVMSSVLGFSAAHLAWITGNQDTKRLAYHHQGVAMQGLHKAIASFSEDNCEAILAASILLTWQATEWRSWASLQHGLTTVLNSMHPIWKQESDLARSLENDRALGCGNSPVTHEEDLASLDHIIPALQNVQKRVGHNQEHYLRIEELIELLRHFRKVLPNSTPEQAFECVQPLRRWLFWLPPAMMRGGNTDVDALAIIAQYYGVGVAIDGLFPDMGGAYLGPLSIRPIEDIYRIIVTRATTDPFDPSLELSRSLMDLPQRIVHKYRNRLQWSPRASVDHYSPGPSSPYHSVQDYRVSSSPSSTSATYAPYTPPLQSPQSVTIASSPTEITGTCVTAPASQALYPSPRLLSQSREMPAFSQSGSLHATGYTPTYVDEMICEIPRMEGSIGASSGIYNESHPVHVGGLVATEPCWT